jgi:catechol 2,3-dioxygenase-like lactoylglutathione lyase family enzyme
MITRLNHIAIRVNDVDAAVAFYTDKLGFRRLNADSVRHDAPWIEMKPPHGGPSIALMPGPVHSAPDAPVLLFGTEDFSATCAELDRRGVSFVRSPQFIRRGAAVIEDPSGNRLVITSEP